MTEQLGPIWLDISRLLHRSVTGGLTGIDRIELAYAEQLAAQVGHRLRLVALNPLGRLVALPRRAAGHFIQQVGRAWREGRGTPRAAALALLGRSLGAAAPARPRRGRASYLLVSHHHLTQPSIIGRLLRATGAAFVPLIHDLIPMSHPEYVRPGDDARHRRRVETVAQLATGVIVSSADTGRRLTPYLPSQTPVLLAPLGVQPPAGSQAATDPAAAADASGPYFLCIGTIEPRKNHLLLLHVWRNLVERLGDAAPRLVLVGKRGWENENILDLLERSPGVLHRVEERGIIPDAELGGLIAGARAVLMPSFTEGYGLPVGEALAAGTPVISSDVPALREVGGEAPEYLGPLDAVAWEAAIQDYARPDSPRRQAQLDRIAHWRQPTHEEHVATVLDFADTISRQAASRHIPSARQPSARTLPAPDLVGGLGGSQAQQAR